MSNMRIGQLVTGVVVGAALAALAVVFGLGVNLFGDTDTTIVVRPDGPNATCIVTGKETEVTVGRNKKINWHVKNFCDASQTLTVGNFRAVGTSGPTDCAAPVAGGATYPFTMDTLAARQSTASAPSGANPGTGKIQLKVNGGVLGAGMLKYDFDICLGSGSGVKADPQLIIER